jgi:hypothetical protein
MAIEISIDFILRLALIGVFLFFGAYLLVLGSREKELEMKRRFYFTFSLFFFFTGLNYLVTEIDIALRPAGSDQTILPNVLPVGDFSPLGLFHPQSSDVYMILFYLLAITPMLYALEANIMQMRAPIASILGAVGIVITLVMLVWHTNVIYSSIVIVYIFVMFVILSLRMFLVYISLARKGVGVVRVMAMRMGVGLLLVLLGVIFSSQTHLTEWAEEIGHAISLLGCVFIFTGVLKLK